MSNQKLSAKAGQLHYVTVGSKMSAISTLPTDSASAGRIREQPCWAAKLLLIAPVADLVTATVVAGGELGLNPLADIGFYSAYVGVLGANYDVQHACAL